MERNINISRAKYDIIPDEKTVKKGKAVMCITTGEVFKSAKEAAEHYGIHYTSLISQISGKHKSCGGGKGRKSKGMRFCYISEMSYKANDISASIIEMKQNGLSKEDAARLKKENDDLREENKEKDNTIKALEFIIQNYKAKLNNISKALAG